MNSAQRIPSDSAWQPPDPPPAPRLAAALAAWRAIRGCTESNAQILFGVGLETLQRIERGEVEPEPELAERIAGVVFSASDAPRTASGTAAAAKAAGGGAAVLPPVGRRAASPDPAPVFPRLCGLVARPAFVLARRDPPPGASLRDAAGDPAPGRAAQPAAFHVEMHIDGQMFALSTDAARAMICDLWPLLAVAADPDLYEKEPRP